jgi:hypothetical protein
VLSRIADFTERRKTRIQDLENILQQTYERYVHDRNTTDSEKSVERVILSRTATHERSGFIAITPGELPLPMQSRAPTFAEAAGGSFVRMPSEVSEYANTQHAQGSRLGRPLTRAGEQGSFVRGRRTSMELDFQE